MFRRRFGGVIGTALFGLAGAGLRGDVITGVELPGFGEGSGVGAVGNVATAFEEEHFEAFFGELFGGPAAADAGADDDGVIGVV